ncbi:MAG: DUF1571 domain-containing protein, partial [Planctomycetota bacterium]
MPVLSLYGDFPLKSGKSYKATYLALFSIAVSLSTVFFVLSRRRGEVEQTIRPNQIEQETAGVDGAESLTRESTIGDVIKLAESALKNMEESLHDYTATFVKQDVSKAGKLNEPSKMAVKIATRMRNDSNDAPKRIYLKFLDGSDAGREVIWGADLYDGVMAVHDTNILVSWKTLWLDPDGGLAMRGQRHPIWEIGLVRLVEQLIERGTPDIDNPAVTVTITKGHEWNGVASELIRVKRAKPNDNPDDYSLVEIVFDPERLLILSYRSFGWP